MQHSPVRKWFWGLVILCVGVLFFWKVYPSLRTGFQETVLRNGHATAFAQTTQKIDTTLVENSHALQDIRTSKDEVFRWSVTLPNKTVFAFGKQTGKGILPVVKISDAQGKFIHYIPVHGDVLVHPTVEKNIISWELSKGITARYTMYADHVKADYLITDASALSSSPLQFRVTHSDSLSADTLANGDIGWRDAHHQDVFVMPKPKLTDRTKHPFDGSYTISSEEAESLILGISIPEDVLSRVQFPLIVDPTVFVSAYGDIGWYYGQSRNSWFDGTDYWVIWDDGVNGANIQYKAATTVAGLGSATATNFITDRNDGGTAWKGWSIWQFSDNKFVIAYQISSTTVGVRTCTTTSTPSISCTALSAALTTGGSAAGSLAVAQSDCNSRIWIAVRDGTLERVFAAGQTGDANLITTWTQLFTQTLGAISGNPQVDITAMKGADKALAIFASNTSTGNITSQFCDKVAGTCSAATLVTGNAAYFDVNDWGNLVRINDYDVRFIWTDWSGASATLTESKWNGSTWSTLSTLLSGGTYDPRYPRTFYDRINDKLYVHFVDFVPTVNTFNEMSKTNGGSWSVVTNIGDNTGSNSDLQPEQGLVDPPYESTRTTSRNFAWLFERVNGVNADLLVSSTSLTSGANPQYLQSIIAQGDTACNTSTSGITATLNSSVTAGDLIVVAVSLFRNTASTIADVAAASPVTDNVSNTYTLAVKDPNPSATQYSTQIFYATATTGGSSFGVTVKPSTTGYCMSIAVAEYAGVTTLDQVQHNTSSATTTPTSNSTATTAQASELIVGAFNHQSTNVETPSAGTNYFIREADGSGSTASMPIVLEDRTVNATGAYAATMTWGSSETSNSVIATFSGVAPTSTPIPTLTPTPTLTSTPIPDVQIKGGSTINGGTTIK